MNAIEGLRAVEVTVDTTIGEVRKVAFEQASAVKEQLSIYDTPHDG